MNDHHHREHEHHHHDVKSELSFDEKLIKLLDHWLKHNEDHAQTYLEWSKRSRKNNLEDVGRLLADVVDLTAEISGKFKEAAALMKR